MIFSKLVRQTALNGRLVERVAQRLRTYSSKGPEAGGHGGHDDVMWKRVFYFVAIPAVVICTIHTYIAEQEHWEHWRRPEYVPYEFRNVRTKKFPWGDGQHSLFHNPITNPLPTGYEPLPPELSAKYDPLPGGQSGHH